MILVSKLITEINGYVNQKENRNLTDIETLELMNQPLENLKELVEILGSKGDIRPDLSELY